jgi:ribonuclease BN (tRNA processing enzyme)
MRALVLGVGDAFTRKHFGASAVVEGPEGLVLIDCPDLIHRALADAGKVSGWDIGASDIHDIIITHLHGDHCNGLESFGFYRWVERMRLNRGFDRGRVPRIHCWAPVAARLWERLAPAMDMVDAAGRNSTTADYFDVRTLDPGVPATIAGLTIRCRPTRHPVPTIGVIISDSRATLGWSGDTAFDPGHIAWLSSADLIVHESNEPPAHTPLADLEALPADLKRKMRLIHLADDTDTSNVSIRPLREGEIIEI